VFTSFRIFDQQVPFYKDHLIRLYRGAEFLFGDNILPARAQFYKLITEDVVKVIKHTNSAANYIRITVFTKTKTRSIVGNHLHWDFIIHWDSLSSQNDYSKGVKLKSLSFEKSIWPSYLKLGSLGEKIYFLKKAKAEGFDDILFYDEKGFLEASTSNLFLIKGKEIITPPIRAGIFAGITRKYLLKFFQRKGIPYVEQDVDIRECDGGFLSNSVRGLIDIKSIDDKIFSTKNRLEDEFRSFQNQFLYNILQREDL